MTAVAPADRVAEILVPEFRPLTSPLRIGGLEIAVEGAFVGTGDIPDLVLIGDMATGDATRLRRTVEGVGRALDIVASRRPLTVVVFGPRPDASVMRALTRYARILPVGDGDDAAALRDWLAVLLPLDLTPYTGPRGEVASSDLAAQSDDDFARALIATATLGEGAVAEKFHAAVEAPFIALLAEEGDLGEEAGD